MEESKTTNERLASLEAKLEFLKELLKEIRDDVKEQPTREEVSKLEDRIKKLEDAYTSVMIKVSTAAAIIMIAIEIGLKLLFK